MKIYKSPKCIEYDEFKTSEAAELEANNYKLSPDRENYYASKEKELLSQMSNEDLQELIDTPNLPSQAKAFYASLKK